MSEYTITKSGEFAIGDLDVVQRTLLGLLQRFSSVAATCKLKYVPSTIKVKDGYNYDTVVKYSGCEQFNLNVTFCDTASKGIAVVVTYNCDNINDHRLNKDHITDMPALLRYVDNIVEYYLDIVNNMCAKVELADEMLKISQDQAGDKHV